MGVTSLGKMASVFGNWQSAIDKLTAEIRPSGRLKVFGTLNDNSQRFQFVCEHDFLKNVPWLSLYWENCPNMRRKSREKSVHFRKEGNKYFQKKQYEKAVEMYNKSILHAPASTTNSTSNCDNMMTVDPDPVLALSLGNRSAALFHLQYYMECLDDINMSLASGYPWTNSHKLLIRKISCLLCLGCMDEAQQGLQDLKKHSATMLEKDRKDSLDLDIKMLEKRILHTPNRSPMRRIAKQDDTPQVSYGVSDLITQASSAIVMKHTSSKGRHLIAEKSIKAGDTLIVEHPYAAVLLPDHYVSHCNHCFQALSFAPVSCEECSMVLYCSVECRKKAWSTYHSVECCYQDLLFSVGIAHLSLRILLTAGHQFLLDFLSDESRKQDMSVAVDRQYDGNYQAVYQLMTHEADMEVEDLFQYTLTAHLLLMVLLKAGWIPDLVLPGCHMSEDTLCIGELLLRHILQLVCNAHAITELQVSHIRDSQLVDSKSQVRVATAIYPTASLMNHSCDPTIISSFQGDILVVRAVKDVTAGEEIFNCYGPHYKRMVQEERQQILRNQYFFQCCCPACTNESNSQTANVHQRMTLLCPECGQKISRTCVECLACQVMINTEILIEEIRQSDHHFQKGLEHLNEMNISAATVCFYRCVDVRERSMFTHHRSLCEARDCLARCYAMTGDFFQAAKYLEKNLSSTELHYGDTSIELAYELQKLAEVLFNSRQVTKAQDIINRALGIFKVHFGEESQDKNMEELKQMKDCLKDYDISSQKLNNI